MCTQLEKTRLEYVLYREKVLESVIVICFFLNVLGLLFMLLRIEPKAPSMLSMFPTPELHPQPHLNVLNFLTC